MRVKLLPTKKKPKLSPNETPMRSTFVYTEIKDARCSVRRRTAKAEEEINTNTDQTDFD